MTTHQYKGGCHCGNIIFEMGITDEPDSYSPRVCDCGFCRKHAASFISDSCGKLVILIKDAANLNKYHQGSQVADFLICKTCGVLVAACYEEQGHRYAAVNSRVVEQRADFGSEKAAAPSTLNAQEKVRRWKNIWFSDVSITMVDARHCAQSPLKNQEN